MEDTRDSKRERRRPKERGEGMEEKSSARNILFSRARDSLALRSN